MRDFFVFRRTVYLMPQQGAINYIRQRCIKYKVQNNGLDGLSGYFELPGKMVKSQLFKVEGRTARQVRPGQPRQPRIEEQEGTYYVF